MDLLTTGKSDRSFFKLIPRQIFDAKISFSCGQWLENEIYYILQSKKEN